MHSGIMERRRPHRQLWNILGKKLPDNEVVFFAQVILVYIVILTSIINLSRGAGDSNLWTCLMGSCLGYLLPNPKIDPTIRPRLTRHHDEPDAPHAPEQQLDGLFPGERLDALPHEAV